MQISDRELRDAASTGEAGRAEPQAGVPAVGGRLVRFEFCISMLVWTLRQSSRVYQLPAGASGLRQSLPYTFVSLLLGWWGVPWGILYTPLCIFTNLTGGREVAQERIKDEQ